MSVGVGARVTVTVGVNAGDGLGLVTGGVAAGVGLKVGDWAGGNAAVVACEVGVVAAGGGAHATTSARHRSIPASLATVVQLRGLMRRNRHLVPMVHRDGEHLEAGDIWLDQHV